MRHSTLSKIIILAALALPACGAPSPAPPETPPVSAAPPATPVETPPAAQPAMPSPEFAALPFPYNEASYAAGMRTWKLCQSCHLTAEGAGHLVGPNLHGMFGRQVATAEGFPYSPALAAETFVWTPEMLDTWLQNPRTFVPGNRMSFSGVRRESDRLAVIAYLMIETGAVPEAPASE